MGLASPSYALSVGLRPERMPRHVAIIMDGNGRWARESGQIRTYGHQAGTAVVRPVTEESVRLGIAWLTLYAFSSENWSRPRPEVDCLMGLFAETLDRELPTFRQHQVRLRAIGRLDRLPADVRARLDHVLAETRDFQAMTLCLALSYGGREEIVDACRALAAQVLAGQRRPADIDEQAVQDCLYASEAPDVDLLLRTAGEQRVSNLLPWQSYYAEFVSVPEYWPDFTVAVYRRSLLEYQGRERRFGQIVATPPGDSRSGGTT